MTVHSVFAPLLVELPDPTAWERRESGLVARGFLHARTLESVREAVKRCQLSAQLRSSGVCFSHKRLGRLETTPTKTE